MVTVAQRIRTIILIEKMNNQKEYSEKLGVIDISTFHGEIIEEEENEICWTWYLVF